MPTYYDPITLENLDIDETTILYLVKNGEKFNIKAISGGLSNIRKDPTSNATEYWPFKFDVLSQQLLNQKIFIENKLTDESLTSEEVKDFLGIDPEETPPETFDSTQHVTQQLHQTYAEHMDANLLNPHGFFNAVQPQQEFFISSRPDLNIDVSRLQHEEIQQEIGSLVSEEIHSELYERCSQDIMNDNLVQISRNEMQQKLIQLATLIPDNCVKIKTAARYMIPEINVSLAIIQRSFSDNYYMFREILTAALILGESTSPDLKNLTLELISTMDLEDEISGDLEYFLNEGSAPMIDVD